MSENGQQRDPDRSGAGATGQHVSAEPARRDEGTARPGGDSEPDVLLDVREVSVDSIRLAVDGLDADLSLRARLANLLQIDAGVRVHLQGVELDITGVHAEALLKVRLAKLVQILDRALGTIDHNPQIIEALGRTTGDAIDDVNRSAQQVRRQGDELSAAAQRITDATAEGARAGQERGGGSPARSRGSDAGGATDELGQQVGAIGTAADRPAGRAGGTGGGGEAGAAERTRGRAEEMAGPDGPAKAGQEAGKPDEERGGRTDAGAEEEGPEARGERPASPIQLAEQAGETLRQAGRSVWEAIQGGIAAHRDPER